MTQANDDSTPKKIGDVLSQKKFRPHHQPPQKEKLVSSQEEFVVDRINAETMFSTVYDGLTLKFRLSPVEILLLSKIVGYWEYDSYCWCSQGTFARLSGTTVPTVIKYLGELEKKELIEKVPFAEIKPAHRRYKTVVWRFAPKGVDAMEYIKKRIKQAAEERRRYARDANAHLRSISKE